MKLKNLKGKLISRNYARFLVDWDAACRSKFQYKVKFFLKDFWANCMVYEEFPVLGTRLKIDLYNSTKKIAVEMNGMQHYEFNKFFHNNNRIDFLNGLKRDIKKSEFCAINDIKLIEIVEKDLPLSPEFFKTNFDLEL